MSQQMQKYAEWLVANQNQKGSPEFNTVADAYKQLRGQQAAPQPQAAAPVQQQTVQAPPPPVQQDIDMGDRMDSYGDAMLRSLYRAGEGLFSLPETVSGALGFEGNTFTERTAAAADVYKQKSDALNYTPLVSWEQVKANPSASNVLEFMGETAVGSLPDMAMAMLSAPAYFATYVAPIANERAKNDGREGAVTPTDLGVAAITAAGIATAERVGAKGIFGKGGTTGNIVTRPVKAGVKESGTEAIQNPLEYAGGTVGTETGFDTATAVDQAAAGAVGGFGSGTGIRGTIDVANALVNPSSIGNPANRPDDPQAAADFARDLAQLADEEGLDLREIDKSSSSGAREAIDKTHIRYDGDMKRLMNVLKEQLKLKDTDPEAVQIEKMYAQLAYREARNKTKSTVGQREFNAVANLVGETKEGSELINVMRKTNELTKLHNQRYAGGVSKFTDQLAPFGASIGYDSGAVAERVLRPLISGGLALNMGNPASLAAQLGAVGTGRAIDKLTGRRSIVDRYVRKNQKKGGMDALTEPSILEQARQKEALKQLQALTSEREKAEENQREQIRRQDAFIRGNLPAAKSPEAKMIIATGGLPTEVIMEIARDVAARDPNLAQPARDFIDSVTGQRPADIGDFEGLTGLIREIKTVAANNPEYSKLANPQLAAQLSENFTTPVPMAGGAMLPATAPSDVSAGYVRGIQANNEAADRLADAVSNDTSISNNDKQTLLAALDELRSNLGKDPVSMAQQIGVAAERNLEDPTLAEKYLLPYIARVAGQQEPQIDDMKVSGIPSFSPSADIKVARNVGDPAGLNDMGTYSKLAAMSERESDLIVDRLRYKYPDRVADTKATINDIRKRLQTLKSPLEVVSLLEASKGKLIPANDVATSANIGGLNIDEMAVPSIGEGTNVDIMTRKRYAKQLNLQVREGNFAIGKNDVTGSNYDGARIYVTPQGVPKLEVNEVEAQAPNKSMGRRFATNAVRPNLFTWTYNPTGAKGFLTTIESAALGHIFTTDIQLDVPTELYRKPLNADGTEKDNPTLRPRGFGAIELGQVIGQIRYNSSGKMHPVYGSVKVLPKEDYSAPVIEEFIEMRLPQGEKPPERHPHREIGEKLMQEQRRRYNRDLDIYEDARDFERVADALTDEARFQLERNPDSADWYDEDIAKAIDITAEIIPAVKTDPNAKRMFLLLAALTSIGHKPRINWRYAGGLMLHYQNTGQIGEAGFVYSEKRDANEPRTVNPVTGKVFGLKAVAVEPPLNIFNHLIQKHGVDGAFDWLNQMHTKREIDAVRKEAGYGAQAKLKGGLDSVHEGVMIFGQKVSPFYKNLNGIRDVTVDVWASRSIRRHTGGLLLPNYDINNRKAAETGLVDAPTAKELPTMKRIFEQVGENIGVSPQAAQAILWEYEQQLYNDLGAKNETERFSEGAELFKQKEAKTYYDRHPEFAEGQSGSGQNEAELQLDEYNEPTLPQRPETSGNGLTPTISSRPPTDAEVRDQLEALTRGDIATIGKKGTLFEQGLNSEAAVEKLAAAFNIGIQMLKNAKSGQAIINKDFSAYSSKSKKRMAGAANSIGVFISGGALDAYDPTTPDTMPRPYIDSPSRGRAYINEEKLAETFATQIPIATIYVKAHEALGHVIEQAILDHSKSFDHPLTSDIQVKSQNFSYNQGVLLSNDPAGSNVTTYSANRGSTGKFAGYSNTLRGEMQELLDAVSGNPKTEVGKELASDDFSKSAAATIIQELMNLQENGFPIQGQMFVPRAHNTAFINFLDENMTNRDHLLFARMGIPADFTDKRAFNALMSSRADNTATAQELMADGLAAAILSPDHVKASSPYFYEWFSNIMNQSDSNKGIIEFYSMPFAAIIAGILAMIAQGEEEDENERGALALGQGALSA